MTLAGVVSSPISPITRRPEIRSHASVGAACRSDRSAIVCRVRPVQLCLLIGCRAAGCRWLRLSAVIAGLAVAFGAVAVTPASAATGVPVWPAASKLALPSDADTAEGGQETAVESVACTGPGNCVAVGFYNDTSGERAAMLASETSGVWGQASKLKLPSDAQTTGVERGSGLGSVACTGPGSCVAVGYYTDTNGSNDHQAMIATETSGVWGQASKLELPSGANTAAGKQVAGLDSVACTGPGSCVAVGYYTDTNGSNDFQAMVATETSGVWGQARKLELPSGANTAAGKQIAALDSVACTGPGSCVAVGYYTDTNGSNDYQAMVATETSGVWGQASEATLPSGANTAAGKQYAALDSVACTGPGSCVAVGYYTDTNGSNDYQAMVATETSGVWGQASEATLPSGANTAAGKQDADLYSVACTGPGSCVAVGYYTDTNGSNDYQAMVATETSGAWGQASEATLPSGANTAAGEQKASLDSVTCTGPGSCVAVGSYADTNGSDDRQAMVLSSVASLAVSTTGLPSVVAGSAYSVQLSATGGAGSYTWSVGSGALPAGLSLNASTGVISGTPTAGGTSSFTIAVSDPGPPGQQASAALSILVSPPPPSPSIRPGSPHIGTVKIKGSKLTVTISCAGTTSQSCTGTLALTTLEHFTGHKLTAISAAKTRKKPKKTTRTVTLGRKTYSLVGGASTTLTITLDATGKQLLARYRKLPAKLTVTPTASKTAAATKTVTITPRKAKRKRS